MNSIFQQQSLHLFRYTRFLFTEKYAHYKTFIKKNGPELFGLIFLEKI